MMSRVRIILLFLLLGVVANVAVAWGISISWPQVSWVGQGRMSIDGEREWMALRSERLGHVRIVSLVWESDRGGSTDGRDPPQPLLEPWSLDPSVNELGPRDVSWQEAASGWPLLAMWWRHTTPNSVPDHVAGEAPPVLPGDTLERAFVLDWQWLPRQLVLPLGLVVPNFFINTAIYAWMLWVFLCGPFVIRRARRRRRGLCAACAYPVGQSHVCTECGAAV